MTTEYPESIAKTIWRQNGLHLSIVWNGEAGHYCAYCRFPKRPVREAGYQGILTWVPVHGGITFAKEGKDGSFVYGFDCGHSEDEKRPELQDIDWLKAEAERMADAINAAKGYERRFLRCITNRGKLKAIEDYHAELKSKGIHFDLQDNFGAMISVLCGVIK